MYGPGLFTTGIDHWRWGHPHRTPSAHPEPVLLPKKKHCQTTKSPEILESPFSLKMTTFPRLYGGDYDARKNVVPRIVSIDFAMLRATFFGAPKSTSSKQALAGSENRPFCFTVQFLAVFGELKRRKLIGGKTSKSAIFWLGLGMRRHGGIFDQVQ